MGIALPGGIAAKKDNLIAKYGNIMGDGARNMCYPDASQTSNTTFQLSTLFLSNGKYEFFIKDNTKTQTTLVWLWL